MYGLPDPKGGESFYWREVSPPEFQQKNDRKEFSLSFEPIVPWKNPMELLGKYTKVS